MKFLNPIKELAFDLLKVHEYYANTMEPIEIHTFFQLWPSTNLGFGGAGGSALTTASTIVIFHRNIASVFFGGTLAYRVKMNGNGEWPGCFEDDLKNEAMAPVPENKTRYFDTPKKVSKDDTERID